MSVVFLVVLGLVYDNAVIAAGKFIGEGAFLKLLNGGRFWSHAFLTPLLAFFAYGALRKAGVSWARKKAAKGLFISFTAMLMLIEVVF